MFERIGIGIAIVGLVLGMLFFAEQQQAQRMDRIEDSIAELGITLERLHSAIATSQDDLNFRIGLISGRLLERGEE